MPCGKGGLPAVENNLPSIDSGIFALHSLISNSDKKNGSEGDHFSDDSGIWPANEVPTQDRVAAKGKKFSENKTPRDLGIAAGHSNRQAGTREHQATEQTAVATNNSPSGKVVND